MAQNQIGFGQKSVEEEEEDRRPSNDSRKRMTVARVVQPVAQLSSREKWRETRPTKTLVFWFLAAAVILTMVVGFTWSGWVTHSAAQSMAATSARQAVVERLAPICVAQFNQDPAKVEKLTALQAVSDYQRYDYVQTQGWATMPGEQKPDLRVAQACAIQILQISQ